ncbi:MAG: hypothetical protein LBV41_07295 [Cytophagaceae bacterium]|jgi:hypothetical protein|nr:hypothetical protein [Cytophagaceae bacterium]
MKNKISIGTVFSEGIANGLKNFPSLLGKKIMFAGLCLCLFALSALSASAGVANDRDSEKMLPASKNREALYAKKELVNGEVYVLDSLHTDFPDGAYERTYHTYNNRNELILSIAHWYNSSGNNEGGFKEERDYDANGNQILMTFYTWNDTEKSWMPDVKFEFTFDSNNNVTEERRFNGNGMDWVAADVKNWTYDAQNRIATVVTQGTEKEEYTYLDDTDKKTSSTAYNYNASAEDWEPFFKQTFTYDDSKNLLVHLSAIWLGTEWFDGTKIEYGNYTQYGDAQKVQEFEMGDTEWILSVDHDYEYTYNQEGREVTVIEKQTFRNGSTQFYRSEYAYDQECDNRELTLYVTYSKVNEDDEWAGANKFEYAYENCLWGGLIEYLWDDAAKEWKYGRKSEITYDENSCMEYETGYYWDGTDWVANQFNHYYWSKGQSSIKQASRSHIDIFSDNGYIVVTGSTTMDDVYVYSISGNLQRVVRVQTGEVRIPVSPGIYIVKIGNNAVKVPVL